MINLLTAVDTLGLSEATKLPEMFNDISGLTVSDIYSAITNFAFDFVLKLIQIALI